MSINRTVSSKIKVENKPWEMISIEIGNALDQMHNVFSTAFSDGLADEKTPEGRVAAQKKELFEIVWSGLSGLDISTFHSVDEIDRYYTSYIANLEFFIKDYCRTENLTLEDVPKSCVDLLGELAKTYYTLVKQSFILKLFKLGDEPSVVLPHLEFINKESKEIEKESDVIDILEIKRSLDAINVLFFEIINQLKSKGFGEIDADISRENITVDLTKVKEMLNRIPPVAETNGYINRLDIALQSGNKSEIKLCRTQLKKVADVTEEVLNQLNTAVSDDLKQKAKNLYLLLQQSDLFKKKLIALNSDFQKLDVFPMAIQMYGYKDGHTDVKSGFIELKQHAQNLSELCSRQWNIDMNLRVSHIKQWKFAQEQINELLPRIVRKIAEFVQPYCKHINLFQEVSQRVDKLNDKQNKVDTLRMLWAARLKKAEDAWKKCSEAMSRAQDRLLCHSESTVDYVKSFFKRHKLSMLLGGVGGTGSGVTLSALLLSFEVTSTLLLVGTGAVVGLATATLVGMGVDRYRQSKSGNEERPLSRLDRVKIDKSIFKDISFKDAFENKETVQADVTSDSPKLK